MLHHCAPLKNLQSLSSLVRDLLHQEAKLEPFIADFFSKSSLIKAVSERTFDEERRKTLVEVLRLQTPNPTVLEGELLDALALPDTLTVTTGHQLNILTGPAFFVYKVAQVLTLAKQLSEDTKRKIVPIYWMASEDHDFEEIANVCGNQRVWEWITNEEGAVGRMKTYGLSEIVDSFISHLHLPEGREQAMLRAYAKAGRLTDATRVLVREIFKDTPVLVLDADDPKLKALFRPVIEKELNSSFTEKAVQSSSSSLEDVGFHAQVHPREINLFYLTDSYRKRIIKQGDCFALADESKEWTKTELLETLEKHPEQFSPNVILRPVYQEYILPNVCYVGGPGEISYWLQLKGVFDQIDLPFPILMPRSSCLVLSEKRFHQLKSFPGMETRFHPSADRFVQSWVIDAFPADENWNALKSKYDALAQELSNLLVQAEGSLEGKAKAIVKRQSNDFERAEKSLRKAWKKKNEAAVHRLEAIHAEVYPLGTFQERKENYFYLNQQAGGNLLSFLLEKLPAYEPSLILCAHSTEEFDS